MGDLKKRAKEYHKYESTSNNTSEEEHKIYWEKPPKRISPIWGYFIIGLFIFVIVIKLLCYTLGI